ncbi:MAG TPA: fumarate hydratase [Firmicutes bacterium]|nr:fumarate hydratase [Bacillota bacterium]
MRDIYVSEIVEAVQGLCIEANCDIGDDVLKALGAAMEVEESEQGREAIRQIIENNMIARDDLIPACQDTGLAVVFVELGQEVHIAGGSLCDAINEGVRRGYVGGYLRKSVVRDPLRRENTGDNTPAFIHISVVPGDRLTITVAPKGAGSENMSAIAMLPPSAGEDGVKEFVIETVRRAGPNPCPPVIVGVGIGGTFEGAAILAKRALLRPLGERNSDSFYAGMEDELLRRINDLGIGPQGFGGRVTALAVHIEVMPCHIASLPVAVNLNCHASRHKTITL